MITDLRKLKHVIAVAEAESFTRASGVLSISQSALTKSVAEVEHLLDIRLFQRLPRGVKLTEAGEVFVEGARRILADTEDLMSGVDKIRDLRAGRLRIGVAPAAYLPLIEDPVAAFARIYPGVHIEVVASDLEQNARALAGGQLDVVAGEANYLGMWSELDAEDVYPLRNYFIARPGHPARHARPEVAVLMRYPLVVPSDRLPTEEEVARLYAKVGMSPRPPQYRCDSMGLVRKLVLQTDAIAPVVGFAGPGREMQENFWVIEGVVELRQHVLGLATNRVREQSPPVRAFREIFNGFR